MSNPNVEALEKEVANNLKNEIKKIFSSFLGRHWYWFIILGLVCYYSFDGIESCYANRVARNRIFNLQAKLLDSTDDFGHHYLSEKNVPLYDSYNEAILKIDNDDVHANLKISLLSPFLIFALSLLITPLILFAYTVFNFLKALATKDDMQISAFNQTLSIFKWVMAIFTIFILLIDIKIIFNL